MSKVIKGIGKAVKGLVKGVKKVFKKITDSKIGKVILIAAAIYLGGAAFGMWNSPFQSINGVFVKGASNAAAGSVASTAAPVVESAPAFVAGGGDVAASTVANAATSGASGAAAGNAITNSAMGAFEPGVASNSAKLGSMVGQSTANLGSGDVVSKGIVNRLLSGARTKLAETATWAKENPILAATGLNAVAGAASPDEMDIIELRRRQDEEDRLRREKNLSDVAGIDLRISPRPINGQPLRRNGIISGQFTRTG
jgi:hypothetical protein